MKLCGVRISNSQIKTNIQIKCGSRLLKICYIFQRLILKLLRLFSNSLTWSKNWDLLNYKFQETLREFRNYQDCEFLTGFFHDLILNYSLVDRSNDSVWLIYSWKCEMSKHEDTLIIIKSVLSYFSVDQFLNWFQRNWKKKPRSLAYYKSFLSMHFLVHYLFNCHPINSVSFTGAYSVKKCMKFLWKLPSKRYKSNIFQVAPHLLSILS